MEAAQFEWLITDLEMMFGRVDNNESTRLWKIEKYYEALGDENKAILEKAVKYLLETHKYKRFPLIGDIKEAIDFITIEPKSIKEDDDDPFPCRRCDGFGWRLASAPQGEQDYSPASPCDCAKGKILKQAWQNRKKFMKK